MEVRFLPLKLNLKPSIMTKEYQEYVNIGLKARKLSIPKAELTTIIKVIELVQKRGGKTNLKDLCKIEIKH